MEKITLSTPAGFRSGQRMWELLPNPIPFIHIPPYIAEKRKELTNEDRDRLLGMDTPFRLSISYDTLKQEGLKWLSEVDQLAVLDLRGCVSDELFLQSLSSWNHHADIWLGFAQMKDQHISLLEHVTNLTRLCLWQTKVTDRGLVTLRKAKTII